MASVLIPLAQGCEELEAITVVDLMRRAGFDVVTAGLNNEPIKASRGSILIADTELNKVLDKAFDMIVLPGGLPGADHLNDSKQLHQLIEKQNAEHKWLAAICAAPKVLASVGLLDGKKATSFPGALEGYDLSNVDYVEEAVVVDGNIVTSRGPGTAMDFALTLIELLAGKEKRDTVEKPLQRP